MRKAVILAGGTGSRLSPITQVINKHLLPVGKYPMIYWSILKVKDAGLEEILLVTNRESLSSFSSLLGEGEEFGIRIKYQIQEVATGIAGALSLAKEFVGDEKFLVLLGDNLFEDSLKPYVNSNTIQEVGATIFLKEVQEPKQYGIAVLDGETDKIITLQEKPNTLGPAFCITGIYIYDSNVFSYIQKVSPSIRGELEITDVNRFYLQDNKLTYHILSDWWIDAGTHETLFSANYHFYNKDNAEVGL